MVMRLVFGILGGVAAMLAGTAAISRDWSGISDRDQKIMDQWLAGKTPGRPVACIPLNQVRSSQYVGDRTILYRMSRNLVYRNDPPGGCPGLGNGRGLITRTPSTQLCRGDIALVQDFVTRMPGGSCAMGDFVPYRSAR
jgi:hypothetical protein